MIIFSRWTNLRKSAHFSGISVVRIAGIDRPSLHDDETAFESRVRSICHVVGENESIQHVTMKADNPRRIYQMLRVSHDIA